MGTPGAPHAQRKVYSVHRLQCIFWRRCLPVIENSDETHLFAVYYIEYAQSTGAIGFVMGSMVSWEKLSSSNNGHFWDRFSHETIDLTRPTLTYSESASKTTVAISSSVRPVFTKYTIRWSSSHTGLRAFSTPHAYLWWKTRTEPIFNQSSILNMLSLLVQSVLSQSQWFARNSM